MCNMILPDTSKKYSIVDIQPGKCIHIFCNRLYKGWLLRTYVLLHLKKTPTLRNSVFTEL